MKSSQFQWQGEKGHSFLRFPEGADTHYVLRPIPHPGTRTEYFSMKSITYLHRLFRNHKLLAATGLLMLCAIVNPAFGQSNERLLGRVYDARSGAPIAGALVQVEATAFGAQTDENGVFRIENLSPGSYTLLASMIGYTSQSVKGVVVSPDVTHRIEIALTPLPIGLDSVIIVGRRARPDASLSGEKVVLKTEDIERYRSLGMAQLLQQVAGVEVASAGGGSSRAVIRIHGSSANQVLVLLDGQRLNNPQTGEVDLSDIPIDQIERIEVIRQGNAALYGSNAFAGVIAFHTRQHLPDSYTSARTSLGSFATAAGNAETGLSLKDFSLLLQYGQDYSRQNFPYHYQGETFTRENAWYRNRKLLTKLSYRSARQRTAMLYHYRRGEQGLPSAFYNELNHFNARKSGDSHTLQFNHRRFWGTTGFSDLLLAYHRLDQLFNNERDFSPFTRYKTRQRNETYEANLTTRWFPQSSLETRIGATYLEERLKHTNLLFPTQSIGKKQRSSRGVYGGVEWDLPRRNRLWRSVQLRGALRLEKYFDQPARGFPLIGFTIVPAVLPSASISVNRARGIRYPDFNSLFWKGDARARGNPALLPEESDLWNGSFRIHFSNRFLPEMSIYYYSERIRNLIFWHRTVNGVWEPRNEARATRQGVDIQLRYRPLPEHLHLQLGYSYIQALNKSDEPNRHNKIIPFVPRHTLNGSIWAGWNRIQLLVNYRRVDERHTVAANTAPPLPGYQLWDVTLTIRQQLGKFRGEANFAIKNLTGADYQLLFGFPMPGREYQFTLKLSFNQH